MGKWIKKNVDRRREEEGKWSKMYSGGGGVEEEGERIKKNV